MALFLQAHPASYAGPSRHILLAIQSFYKAPSRPIAFRRAASAVSRTILTKIDPFLKNSCLRRDLSHLLGKFIHRVSEWRQMVNKFREKQRDRLEK